MDVTMQKESVLKLGKELVCPICLGLLKSAVHLPCNHCFCRACIQQSVSTKASCPVCKKPAHKRDFRPAASVDLMVTAYSQMEHALGVQILCSQPAKTSPPEKNEDPGKGKRKRLKSTAGPLAVEGKENEVPAGLTGTKKAKLKDMAEGLSVGAFKAPKNIVGKGGGELAAGLTACAGKKQEMPSNLSVKPAKTKKKSAKGAVAKAASASKPGLGVQDGFNSPPLPAHTDSAPAAAAFDFEGGLQPFFWAGEDCGTQEHEGAMQLRPTQASPPITFSDLVNSGKKRGKNGGASAVMGGESDAEEAGTRVKAKKKDQKKGAGSLAASETENQGAKPAVAREEFYSCEDDTVTVDALLLETVHENAELATPVQSKPDVEVGEKKQKGRKKKVERRLVPEQEAMVDPTGKKGVAQERGRLVAEIRACVAEAVGAMRGAPSKVSADAKVMSAQPPQGGKRKRGGATAGRTAVTSQPTGVVASPLAPAVQSQSPHSSTKPVNPVKKTPSLPARTSALVAPKTPATDSADNGLCPSTSRPLGSQNPSVTRDKPVCGFCGVADESEVAGKLVRKGAAPPGLLEEDGLEENGASTDVGGKRRRVQLPSVMVHELCAQWAPNVFFEGEELANVDSELARSRQLKCSVCGFRGAALGCFLPRCRHTYHYACARGLEGCRFDEESYVMLCPDHGSEMLPYEMESDSDEEEEKVSDADKPAKTKGAAKQAKANDGASGGTKRTKTAPSVQASSATMKWPGAPGAKWVLTGSSLSNKEKDDLALLAYSAGAQIVKDWSPAVTHVITATDAFRRSKRTLKYLTGVLTGQWVVTPEWVTESLAQGKPAKEAIYEVLGDVQNQPGGAKRGRMAVRKGATPLFNGLDVFLSGDWPGTPSKGDMAAVVSVGGGTVLARRPLATDSPAAKTHKSLLKTVVIYFGGQAAGEKDPRAAVDNRRTEALALTAALRKGSAVVHHRWLLDSASAFHLQDPRKY